MKSCVSGRRQPRQKIWLKLKIRDNSKDYTYQPCYLATHEIICDKKKNEAYRARKIVVKKEKVSVDC
ncbi:hypothetical protein EGK14_07875 [Erwinia sp. 198]|nr:hypothetical protein EGK14_07875 [Erwinia sp. 198]